MSSALVLLSGGIDSAVALAIARKENERVWAYSMSYGQSHSKELDHAKQIADYYGIAHSVVNLPDIFRGYGSALMDGTPMPHLTYEQLMEAKGTSPTYVPYRNGNLLSVATTIALVYAHDKVYWAPHATDAHNWAYDDCTPEFVGAMANAIYIGSAKKVRLVTPLQWLTKDEVVRLGLQLKVPFSLTWSCYAGRRAQCGECPTCVERIHAFKSCDAVDPVDYEIGVRW